MADHSPQGRRHAIHRRDVVKAGLSLPMLALGLPLRAEPEPWRTFEIVMRVEVIEPRGVMRVWLPLPFQGESVYQRLVKPPTADQARVVRIARETTALYREWGRGTAAPTLTATMQVATRPYDVRLDGARGRSPGDARELARYLAPTKLIPVDGIVRDTAHAIVGDLTTPLARAHAIYDWVVDNTFRDPAVQGCGLGDIRWMLESRSLGGKCADLNALFVGLCRSVGLPARDVYGLRVAPSRSFKSLGRSGEVTTAQHCRAEIFVERVGWVPADPADVRKLVLEERAGASLTDPDIAAARARLFGSWEENWVAFNHAHDVVLPGATGKTLPFFMYPQLEVDGVRRNELDAASFRYTIAAREIDSRS
jgi:transglutaminase-like putative cysteine protease